MCSQTYAPPSSSSVVVVVAVHCGYNSDNRPFLLRLRAVTGRHTRDDLNAAYDVIAWGGGRGNGEKSEKTIVISLFYKIDNVVFNVHVINDDKRVCVCAYNAN